MRTLILCFDRLPAFLLGCYGEFRFSTPHFDSLADEGLLLERCLISPAAGNFSSQWLTLATGTASKVRDLDQKEPLSAALAEIQADSRENFCLVWRMCLAALPRGILRQACVAVFQGENDVRLREVDLAIRRAPQFIAEEELSTLLGELESWERQAITAIARMLEADAWLGRMRTQLEIAEFPHRLVVVGDAGDARAGISDSPAWCASIGEAAVHIPVIIHEPPLKSPRRWRPLISVADVIRELAGKTTAFAPAQPAEIRCESPLGLSVWTPDWLLLERRAEPEAGEERELRLHRLPEDPWGIRDVSGEHFDLVDQWHSRRTIAPVRPQHQPDA